MELGLGHCERIAVDAEQRRVFVASDSGCVCCYDALSGCYALALLVALQLQFSVVNHLTGSIYSLLLDHNDRILRSAE